MFCVKIPLPLKRGRITNYRLIPIGEHFKVSCKAGSQASTQKGCIGGFRKTVMKVKFYRFLKIF